MSEELIGQRRRGISGRVIVASMFAMGFLATGLLFLYWNLHLMPFMPLQQAIVTEFTDSSPRVDGGRRKMHRQTPMLLRIVMRVPFDPTVSDPETDQQLQHYLNRIRELATAHTDIASFEMLELHFYFPVGEKQRRERMIRRNLESWQDVDEDGNPLAHKESSTVATDRASVH